VSKKKDNSVRIGTKMKTAQDQEGSTFHSKEKKRKNQATTVKLQHNVSADANRSLLSSPSPVIIAAPESAAALDTSSASPGTTLIGTQDYYYYYYIMLVVGMMASTILVASSSL